MKYEEALSRLEAIVDKMERGDMDIDTMGERTKKGARTNKSMQRQTYAYRRGDKKAFRK